MKRIASLLLIPLVYACGSTISVEDEKKLTNNYRSGNYLASANIAEKSLGFYDDKKDKFKPVIPTKVDNALLHMNAAESLRLSGNDERAIKHFNVVDEVLFSEQNREFISTSYEPTPGEKILTNFYKAISYWNMNDDNNARIEFNRANERTRLAVKRYEKEIKEAQKESKDKLGASNALLNDTRISGEVTQWDVYDNFTNPAVAFLNSLFLASKDGSESEQALVLMKRVKEMSPSGIPSELYALPLKGENVVWVLAETGYGPKLTEKRVDIPFRWKGTNLLLQMAFPKMQYTDNAVSLNNYFIGGTSPNFYEISNMDTIAQTELKKRWPGIVASQVSMAIIKAYIQYEADKKGDGASLAAFLFTSAVTSAETTSWEMTPKSWQITKLNNMQGKSFTVRYGNNEKTLTIPTGAAIIYVKQHSPQTEPLIKLLSL
jgi:hypothetical protein